ncbi:MAG: hypothetical protein PHP21_04710, partial [Patescibacteria group bacterium]|nr:hypothetical protein [Patescibacteria group bacterium]
ETLKVLATFNYSKATTEKAPEIVVLGNPGDILEDTEGTIVTTEYLELSRRIFKRARIIVVKGKAESFVVGGFARYCVDLYDQGETARANGLEIIGGKILESPTIFLASEGSPLLPAIELFAAQLQEAFAKLQTKRG